MELDPDILWDNMLSFRHRNMLTLKNLDNDLPCESWDSMYHTSWMLIISAFRLARTNDKSVADVIVQVLNTILEQGINFRGFNSKGEYWKGVMLKYYPEWGNKEVFRDTSRDQLLSMNLALYFLNRYVPKEYSIIHEKIKKIASIAVNTLIEHDYDLGTTYGDCRSFELGFGLLYRKILGDSPLRAAIISIRHNKWVPKLIRLIKLKKNYFTYSLILIELYLTIQCFDANDGTYSENIKLQAIKGFKTLLKSRLKDENLLWELLYYDWSKTCIVNRNFSEKLKEKFVDMPDPKIQDFIWQRHPSQRLAPWEDWKHFYAPYHDYLVVWEMLNAWNPKC